MSKMDFYRVGTETKISALTVAHPFLETDSSTQQGVTPAHSSISLTNTLISTFCSDSATSFQCICPKTDARLIDQSGMLLPNIRSDSGRTRSGMGAYGPYIQERKSTSGFHFQGREEVKKLTHRSEIFLTSGAKKCRVTA